MKNVHCIYSVYFNIKGQVVILLKVMGGTAIVPQSVWENMGVSRSDWLGLGVSGRALDYLGAAEKCLVVPAQK